MTEYSFVASSKTLFSQLKNLSISKSFVDSTEWVSQYVVWRPFTLLLFHSFESDRVDFDGALQNSFRSVATRTTSVNNEERKREEREENQRGKTFGATPTFYMVLQIEVTVWLLISLRGRRRKDKELTSCRDGWHLFQVVVKSWRSLKYKYVEPFNEKERKREGGITNGLSITWDEFA